MLQINGVAVGEDPKNILEIFTVFPDLQYWSKDALQKLFVGAFEIGIEMVEGTKGGKFTRFINDARKRIDNFHKIVGNEDRDWVLARIYNEVLRVEGLSTLHGFGFSNQYGDWIPGNSEIQSLYGRITPFTKEDQQKLEKETLIMAEFKRSQLVQAAKELNKELGLDPAIDVKLKGDALRDIVYEASKLVVPETDEFSDETQAVLDSFIEAAPSKKKAVKEPEVQESEETGDLISILARTKKLVELKALVEEHDEFKKLRKTLDDYAGLSGPRELRPVMEACLGVEPVEKTAPTSGPKKKGVMAERVQFFTPLIEKGGALKKDLVNAAEKAFPEATRASLMTIISDGKNPKYNKFDRLIIEDADKCLSFK